MWRRGVSGLVREAILACNFMCQAKDPFRVPVNIPVLQGTGESIYMDLLLLQSCDLDFDLTVYRSLHVRKGLVHLCCHKSTQSGKYNQVFLLYRAINRNNKRIFFSFIVAVLTMLILLDCIPLSHESRYWIIFVGICVSVANLDANDGLSLLIP